MPHGINYVEDGFSVYAYFYAEVETEHEQYFLHDPASVISAVGGALGLFLGFSCLALGTKVVKVRKD